MPSAKTTISNKRLFFQYLKWLPYHLGLINKAAFLLQINEIRPNDVFIVSFPKSGNTWLRFIMAYLINGLKKTISNIELQELIPDVYRSKDLIDKMKTRRFIKCHNTFFEHFPKTIYIYRDYRDVLISYYQYQRSLNEFTGDLSAYLKSTSHTEMFGTWKDHINSALDMKLKHPEKILLLSYENLISNFTNEIKAIISFCELDEKTDISQIAYKTGFAFLKENENEKGSLFKTESHENFFREGKPGGWQDHFSAEDLETIYKDKKLKELLVKLGYSID